MSEFRIIDSLGILYLNLEVLGELVGPCFLFISHPQLHSCL